MALDYNQNIFLKWIEKGWLRCNREAEKSLEDRAREAFVKGWTEQLGGGRIPKLRPDDQFTFSAPSDEPPLTFEAIKRSLDEIRASTEIPMKQPATVFKEIGRIEDQTILAKLLKKAEQYKAGRRSPAILGLHNMSTFGFYTQLAMPVFYPQQSSFIPSRNGF